MLSSATMLSGRAPRRRMASGASAARALAATLVESRARRRTRPAAVTRVAADGDGRSSGGGGGGDSSPAAAADTDPSASSTTTKTIPIVVPPVSGPAPDVDARERGLLYLTDAEADARVDAAAGLLACLDDLRPLDRKAHNASEHVWRAIAEIPPTDRVRLLGALDAGGCRQLWRHTAGRYALPRERAEALLRGHTIWRDLPPAPDAGELEAAERELEAQEEARGGGGGGSAEEGAGEGASAGGGARTADDAAAAAAAAASAGRAMAESRRRRNGAVVEFEGVCERLVIESVPVVAQRPGDRNPIDLPEPGSAAADLRPRPGRPPRRTRRFRLQLFRHARTGQPYARVVLPGALSSLLPEGLVTFLGLGGGGSGGGGGGGARGGAGGRGLLEGPSAYCRIDVGLSLVPVRRDAGADLTLAWPSRDDPDLGGLTRDDLPEAVRRRWPAPERWNEDWKQKGEAGGGRRAAAAGASGGGGGEKTGAAEGWSPFSWTDRDYLRPAGPGVYTGCAYRPTDGLLVEDQFVWLALAKVVDDGEEEEEEEEEEEHET